MTLMIKPKWGCLYLYYILVTCNHVIYFNKFDIVYLPQICQALAKPLVPKPPRPCPIMPQPAKFQ